MAQKFERDTRHVNIKDLCEKIAQQSSGKNVKTSGTNKENKDLGK